jgi:hypothetical protein
MQLACSLHADRAPRTSPVNSRVVFRLSMPDVPSKTCTTARVPSTSSTCPLRTVPSPRRTSTISENLGFCGSRGLEKHW